MKNKNKLHTIIKWAEAELGLTLAVLVLGTVMVGGTTAYVSPYILDTGDVQKPTVQYNSPQYSQMVINQIPVDGLNFTANLERDLYKVTTGWFGNNQDLITTSHGTRGAGEHETYSYKTNLDHPYSGTLWLAGNYESARVNGQMVTPNQALVELKNASAIVLDFEGGDKNIFATLTEVAGGNRSNLVLASNSITELVVIPNETEVLIDNQIQLQAVEIDKYGRALKTYPRWQVEENSKNIVAVDNNGLVTGLAVGHGYVFAQVDNNKTHVEIQVRNIPTTAIASLIESDFLKPVNLFTTLFSELSK